MAQEPMLLDTLNERELEIIALLDGLSNKEIANQLFLAPNTVKWYVRQLNSKFDTKNRHEIVERANELGLLEKQAEDNSYHRPRQNLPRQTTPFVGRNAELDEIHTIIENADVRLLTILAQGGMGKTRIALEASEQQLNHFPDGVYFVPLQALSDVNNIVPQIATSTGFQFSNDERSQKEQLLNFLANKTMLLCIDNWEHLLESADLINEILQSAPDVKILATSREKLNLLSETVYVLRGMKYPDWEKPEDALVYDAVQLLVQSAQRVKPDWTITEDNLDYVARVCRLTQGMPLGILLATSWLDVYSLDRICDEIQKSADILETEMRDVPERQRSIRAVFDHSWERLTSKEQAVLMKMSVFRGGCTPSAAEAVTGANARILQSLVNKALLLRNREGRYDVHELLRQYAEAELEQSGKMQAVSHIHSQYFASFLHIRESDLKGHRQGEAQGEIEADFENIRRAWNHSIEHKTLLILNQMLESLFWYFLISGHLIEGDALFQAAYLSFEKQIPHHSLLALLGSLQSRLLYLERWHYGKYLDPKRANVKFEQCLYIAHSTNNKREIALCHWLLGLLKIQIGDFNEAMTLLEISLGIFRKRVDPFYEAYVLIFMGICGYHSGDTNAALEYMEYGLTIQRDIGDRFGIIYSLTNLIGLHVSIGNSATAERYANEAYILSDGTQISLLVQVQRATIAFLRGNFQIARSMSAKFLEDTPHLNKSLGQFIVSLVACVEGNYHQARQLIVDGLSIAPNDMAKYFLNWSLALATYMLGDVVSAIEANHAALVFAVSARLPARLIWCLPASAMIEFDKGNSEQAVELLSLAFNHPASTTGWLEQWSPISQLQADLEAELGYENYNQAWERGKSLDLETVVQELIDEFSRNEIQTPGTKTEHWLN